MCFMSGKSTQIIGFPLIKFQSEDRIKSLQQGKIYMNTLAYYRKLEEKTGDVRVGDSFEGMFHVVEGKLVFPEEGEILELNNELIKTSYSDGFVFCLFGVKPSATNFEFAEEQVKEITGFGDTALLIVDVPEFEKRVVKAAKDAGFEIYKGFVRYYDETTDSGDMIISLLSGMQNVAYWKRKMYDYQQEYRFFAYSETIKKDHLELEIGDISDISLMMKTSSMLKAKIVKQEGEE